MVSLTKVLRVLNVLIGIAAIALLAAGYWFAWRPLPQTSGRIKAPISSEGRIGRDRLGVVHISADSLEDAAFLQGFATAQDRMWQMDALRRLAAGELAEIVGPGMLEADREARKLRMRRIAEQQYRTLPQGDRALLAAYARGVNFYLETYRDRLPLEFHLLSYEPRPWTVVDSMLVGLQMYRELTTSWRADAGHAAMLMAGDPAKVSFLFPTATGDAVQPGSNAWAISGKHTATGSPILANDPHLQFSLPATWHQVHLQAPGLNVAGVALPGLPFVIIGHNERIAWGVTNLQFDVQDLYLEKFDPQTGRYLYRNRWEQARLEREWIAVKGQRPVEAAVWVTRHGPIFLNENNQYYSLRWAAAEPNGFEFPFADINRARNWEEFRNALRRFPGPGQNFIYADVDGNVGYQATGKLPIRRNFDGNLPVDGSSGEAEWDGWIPFDELPSIYNPASGILVTANQNPFPENYPYRVSGTFASPHRYRQIYALLRSRQKWTPEEMLAVQKDVYSPLSHFLAKQVVAAWDRHKSKDPSLEEAIELLRNWNGQMEKGTAAPVVATLFYQHLLRDVAEKAAPGKGLAYGFQAAPAVVEKLLREKPKDWFEDYDAFLLSSFADAVDEGKRMQGPRIAKWDYGRLNTVTLAHPVISRLPWIGSYFSIGRVPMSGSATTVKQTTQRLGPSMRFVADLADWDCSLQNITIGQSGHILSSHYRDQWKAYYSGKSFPLQYKKVKLEEELRVSPR